MPQPKRYADKNEKQRAYRARRRAREQAQAVEALDEIAEARLTFGIGPPAPTQPKHEWTAEELAAETGMPLEWCAARPRPRDDPGPAFPARAGAMKPQPATG